MNPSESIAPRPVRPPLAILGIPFDNVTRSEAIDRIEAMVASRQPHYLVTPNVDFLVQARADVELRRILLEAHLVLCDGTPLVWASRLLGNPLPERVAGADLVPLLIEAAARKGYRLFFLGATKDSARRAVERLRRLHPRLIIAGHYSPPFQPLLEMDHDEIRRRITEARPDLLFVSFGCPKQEKWIAMHYRQLGVPVTAGVGATVDFLAGQVRRAPQWMQRTGLEWIFRLLQEPRRLFGRYARDLWVFGSSILPQWWRLRQRFGGATRMAGLASAAERSTAGSQVGPALVSVGGSFQRLELPERVDVVAARGPQTWFERALGDARDCLLDLAHVEFIDSTGVGLLIRLRKQLRAEDRQLVLLAPSRPVRRALALMKLDDFFVIAADVTAARRLIQARREEQVRSGGSHGAALAGPLRWRGEITAANAARVWDQTRTQLEALPVAADWKIDLSEVGFIDSTGLGVMVRARNLAARGRHRLRFLAPSPAVRNVVHLARMETLLFSS